MFDYIGHTLQNPLPVSSGWLERLHQNARSGALGKKVSDESATESWKYSSLGALEENNYAATAKPDPAPDLLDKALSQTIGIDKSNAHNLVFVNGLFSAELSDVEPPRGVEFVRFAHAEGQHLTSIKASLGAMADKHQSIFRVLNELHLKDGMYIRVSKNVELDKPIQIVWLTTPQPQSYTVASRVLIELEPGSKAQIFETFTSDDAKQNSFTNNVTEMLLREGAFLQHFRVHQEQEDALHIGAVHAGLYKNAKLKSFHLALGGALKRVDVAVNLLGEGADSEQFGAYLLCNDQHMDYHTSTEHFVPDCTSNEVFRGIAGGRSKAVFNGRIHIHAGAQKTLARLSNKNLLTSDTAEVDTKPELEIYADDVQCAHGATVAQLDELAIHYLQTRGISRAKAKALLSYGFVAMLLEQVPEPVFAEHITAIINHYFQRHYSEVNCDE